jgi:hypothetical protein
MASIAADVSTPACTHLQSTSLKVLVTYQSIPNHMLDFSKLQRHAHTLGKRDDNSNLVDHC